MHQNLFQGGETIDLLLDTIVRNRDKGDFFLHKFVLMPNHIHLLLTVDDDHAIGRAVQLIKGGFSHAYGQTGLKLKAVWQPSYYEHRVRDEVEYERMPRYVHGNPVRRHLVDRAQDYPYSSANPTIRLDEVSERNSKFDVPTRR
jgi:putative transposase